MRSYLKFIGVAALLGEPAALAGSNSQYPVIVTGGSYAPLGDAGSPVPNVTGTQNGVDALALSGWTFPYFDAGYTEITVTTDGVLIVGDGLLGGCTPDAGINPNTGQSADAPGCSGASNFCFPSGGCSGCCLLIPGACTGFGTECGGGCCTLETTYSPGAFGPSREALGTIAAWWESLDDTGVNGISYLQGGGTGSHFLTVDYHGVPSLNDFSGVNIYNFSITLNESGLIQMAYGSTSVSDAGFCFSSSTCEDQSLTWVSLEDPAGTTWVPGLACDVDGGFAQFGESSCSASSGSWPTNTDLTYGSPAGVVPRARSRSPPPTAPSTAACSRSPWPRWRANLGQTAVTNCFPLQRLPRAEPGGAANSAGLPRRRGLPRELHARGRHRRAEHRPAATGTLTTPYPPASGPGTYYVELWLDPANSTGNTSNAVGLSPPLIVGIELAGSVNLAADAGSGGIPPLVPGTGTFPVPITLQNSGLLPANGVEYQLWLTAGNTSIDTTTDFDGRGHHHRLERRGETSVRATPPPRSTRRRAPTTSPSPSIPNQPRRDPRTPTSSPSPPARSRSRPPTSR